MARTKDDSLKYYNQDTKDDDNLQYVEAMHGLNGYAVVHKLWKHIYGSPYGYFCPWDDFNKMLFCKNNGIQIDFLNDVINTCCQPGVEIFNSTILNEKKVLTSKGIQKRWLKIVKECGRTRCKIDVQYLLIPVKIQNEIQESAAAVSLTPSLQQQIASPVQLQSLESTQILNVKGNIKENEIKKNQNGCVTPAPTQNFFLNQENEKNTSEKGMLGAEKFIPPAWNEVDSYFFKSCKNFWDPLKSSTKARRFYDHYTSIGWKTEKGSKILHWQSRAEMWILEDVKREKEAVPREVNAQTQSAQQITAKKTLAQATFDGYLKGAIKLEGIPADLYTFLIDEEKIILASEEKVNLLQQANGDEVKAKKTAVANYFNSMQQKGNVKIF